MTKHLPPNAIFTSKTLLIGFRKSQLVKYAYTVLSLIMVLSCSKDPGVILPDPPPSPPSTLEEQLRGSWTADYVSYAFEVGFDPGIGIEVPFTSRGIVDNPNSTMEFIPAAQLVDYRLSATVNFIIPGLNFPIPIPLSFNGSGDYIIQGKQIIVNEPRGVRRFEVLSHGPFHLNLFTVQPATVPLLGAIDVDLIINYVFDDVE